MQGYSDLIFNCLGASAAGFEWQTLQTTARRRPVLRGCRREQPANQHTTAKPPFGFPTLKTLTNAVGRVGLRFLASLLRPAALFNPARPPWLPPSAVHPAASRVAPVGQGLRGDKPLARRFMAFRCPASGRKPARGKRYAAPLTGVNLCRRRLRRLFVRTGPQSLMSIEAI